ncbi:GxxExxY protein [candidate division WOR-3 bacterium]|nr:GxxExxY protein [candidate division WOR-3 bacterium]
MEFKKEGIPVIAQAPIKVYYDNGEIVGEYNADLLVDDKVMLEIRSKAFDNRRKMKIKNLDNLRLPC